jgi:hypothetical protein
VAILIGKSSWENPSFEISIFDLYNHHCQTFERIAHGIAQAMAFIQSTLTSYCNQHLFKNQLESLTLLLGQFKQNYLPLFYRLKATSFMDFSQKKDQFTKFMKAIDRLIGYQEQIEKGTALTESEYEYFFGMPTVFFRNFKALIPFLISFKGKLEQLLKVESEEDKTRLIEEIINQAPDDTITELAQAALLESPEERINLIGKLPCIEQAQYPKKGEAHRVLARAILPKASEPVKIHLTEIGLTLTTNEEMLKLFNCTKDDLATLLREGKLDSAKVTDTRVKLTEISLRSPEAVQLILADSVLSQEPSKPTRLKLAKAILKKDQAITLTLRKVALLINFYEDLTLIYYLLDAIVKKPCQAFYSAAMDLAKYAEVHRVQIKRLDRQNQLALVQKIESPLREQEIPAAKQMKHTIRQMARLSSALEEKWKSLKGSPLQNRVREAQMHLRDLVVIAERLKQNPFDHAKLFYYLTMIKLSYYCMEAFLHVEKGHQDPSILEKEVNGQNLEILLKSVTPELKQAAVVSEFMLAHCWTRAPFEEFDIWKNFWVPPLLHKVRVISDVTNFKDGKWQQMTKGIEAYLPRIQRFFTQLPFIQGMQPSSSKNNRRIVTYKLPTESSFLGELKKLETVYKKLKKNPLPSIQQALSQMILYFRMIQGIVEELNALQKKPVSSDLLNLLIKQLILAEKGLLKISFGATYRLSIKPEMRDYVLIDILEHLSTDTREMEEACYYPFSTKKEQTSEHNLHDLVLELEEMRASENNPQEIVERLQKITENFLLCMKEKIMPSLKAGLP